MLEQELQPCDGHTPTIGSAPPSVLLGPGKASVTSGEEASTISLYGAPQALSLSMALPARGVEAIGEAGVCPHCGSEIRDARRWAELLRDAREDILRLTIALSAKRSDRLRYRLLHSREE
jgi:hypothetical protein